ncbi:MAG: ABC transporter permease [Planctomycetota bacterium]|jgi:lipopolysaccharide transport system permease protein
MPPTSFSATPTAIFSSFIEYRQLIWQMTKREVIGRYRGSLLGLVWSFVNPILMLIVYTFVFSVVFRARWGESGGTSKAEFAIILFSGLITFNLFAECVNRAPGLIVGNVNYVKKVVFPLEIMPWITMGAALFHAGVSVAVLLCFIAIIQGSVPWTVLWLPVVWLPFLLFTMGLCWFLAATGVYLRDVGQAVGIITTAMLFLSPIFYPISALPEGYRVWLHVNPLTFILEQVRAVTIFGAPPDWLGLSIYLVGATVVAGLGFAWFQTTRRGFADVI